MAEDGTPPNNSEQVELLRGIWNEIKGLNTRIDHVREDLGARIDETNTRLDAVRTDFRDEIDQLRHVMVESDVRLATEVRELSGNVKSLSHLIRAWRDEHRQDREDLRRRVSRIEERIGINQP